MSNEEIAGFAARELIGLAASLERIAAGYSDQDVVQSDFMAGAQHTYLRCAQEARTRAAELGGSGDHLR